MNFIGNRRRGAAFCEALNNDVLHIIEAVAFNAGNEADILLNPSFKHQVVSFAEKEIIMDIHSQRGAHAALPFFELPPVGVVSAPANIPFQRIGFQPPTEPVTHNAEPVLDAANHVAVSIMSDAVGAGFLFFRNDSQNFRHGFSHNLL